MSNETQKYLYGAAIQGIQSYIFQTNELKDIIGASHIVNDICTSFKLFADGKGTTIVTAAGNIKHIFDTKADCEKVVRSFPKEVLRKIPGITISQAVVAYNDNFEEAIIILNEKLKAQRNKPLRSATIGLIGTKRNPRTGLPASDVHHGTAIDSASYKKKTTSENANTSLNKVFFGKNIDATSLPIDISTMTGKNDWIAIIHADGNGLGKIVSTMHSNPEKLRTFSQKLEVATQKAAQKAFKSVENDYNHEEWGIKSKYPFRPIVLGGDDLTIICRADLAIEFTKNFLRHFETETKAHLSYFIKEANLGEKLTACAGIAYIKSTYPFHYGYELAESLCNHAKEDAKSAIQTNQAIPRSCLMFHKIQDSFVEDYQLIIQRELSTKANISLCHGPYYVEETEKRWTIDLLQANCKILDQKTDIGIKSHIREWLTLLNTNEGLANQRLDRIKSLLKVDPSKNKILIDLVDQITSQSQSDKSSNKKTPSYDMLSVLSLSNQIINDN